MDVNSISKFINKAIDKTKSKELSWRPLPDSYNVKLLPEEQVEYASLVDEVILSTEDSYIAPYKTGHLLLLVYKSEINSLSTTSPTSCKVSLRMQDETSKFPVEITNNRDSVLDSPSLIRLYNLVVDSCSTVTSLIDDFLNS